ncbi:hypothetical protein TNCV_493391 [Trichonephila clavipes]|nr:hypothetical protein TNCV_493391 [Trichonephila clavipes]
MLRLSIERKNDHQHMSEYDSGITAVYRVWLILNAMQGAARLSPRLPEITGMLSGHPCRIVQSQLGPCLQQEYLHEPRDDV